LECAMSTIRAVHGGEYAGSVDHCGAALAVQPERARCQCSSAARAWLGLAGGQMAKLALLCQRDAPLPIKVVTARAGSKSTATGPSPLLPGPHWQWPAVARGPFNGHTAPAAAARRPGGSPGRPRAGRVEVAEYRGDLKLWHWPLSTDTPAGAPLAESQRC
jgi:hypothetical protein